MSAENCKGRLNLCVFISCVLAGASIEFSPNISRFQSVKRVSRKYSYKLMIGDFNDE